MENKKGVSKWVWVVIVLVVVGVGMGIYFLLGGSGVGGIPQPPAFPA